MVKPSDFLKKTEKKCKLLLFISYLAFGLLEVLNIYIGYIAFKQFRSDGWSFMGGLIILSSYIVTMPAFLFSVLSVREIRNNINDYQQDSTYRIAIAFQLIGLALLFILTVLFVLLIPHSNSNYNLKQQIIGFCISGFLFLLSCIATFSFSRKKNWAFNLEYIESYILLGFSILLFFYL